MGALPPGVKDWGERGLIGPGLRVTLLEMVKTPSGGGPPFTFMFLFFRQKERQKPLQHLCVVVGERDFLCRLGNWFREQGYHDSLRSDM